MNAIGTILCLPQLVEKLKDQSPVHSFYCNLVQKGKRANVTRWITVDTGIVGNITTAVLNRAELVAVVDLLGQSPPPGQVYTYLRMTKGNLLYHCLHYGAAKKRNSYTICYLKDGKLRFGQIQRYVQVKWSCVCDVPLHCCCAYKHLALVRQLQDRWDFCNSLHLNLDNVARCTVTNSFEAIYVSQIQDMCACIEYDNDKFVSRSPNFIEND